MNSSILDAMEACLMRACEEVCREADIAAHKATGESDDSAAQLRRVADLIRAMELGLEAAFLGPESKKQVVMLGQGSGQNVAVDPVPVMLPQESGLRSLTTPDEVDHLIHDIRGIRTVFSLGSELNLGPSDRAPLLEAAAQMTRRLKPLVQDFTSTLRQRLTAGLV